MQFPQNPAAKTEATMSRIENDVNRVNDMAHSMTFIRDRIMRHAKSLGYYVDPPSTPTSAGVLQSSNPIDLTNALDNLRKEIEHTSGALNVFD